MQDPKSFENFVRGLRKDLPPLTIVEIEKISDTGYNVFLDMDPAIKGQARLTPELLELTGPVPPEEEGEHDGRVLLSYFPEAAILTMGVYVETGLPSSSYGWLLSCLNTIHRPGNGYISKVSIPNPGEEERISVIVGWEVGLYDESLTSIKGLRFLKTLVSSMMHRLFVESCSISVELTKLYHKEFPTGKLDS